MQSDTVLQKVTPAAQNIFGPRVENPVLVDEIVSSLNQASKLMSDVSVLFRHSHFTVNNNQKW
jgi:hypothetical protein